MSCRSPGPHPGGKLRGLAWGSAGLHLGGLSQHALRQIPPPTRWLLLWAVRILLECILVLQIFETAWKGKNINPNGKGEKRASLVPLGSANVWEYESLLRRIQEHPWKIVASHCFSIRNESWLFVMKFEREALYHQSKPMQLNCNTAD